jgi:2-hydroxy-3-oxopropionate reductase
MEKPVVGFIGLGIMGKPMAHNLLRSGYALVVHNRSRSAVEELVEAGAWAAHSPAEIGRQSGLVITMLPDGPDVEQVALGPDGLIHGLAPGAIWVDMSTIAPAVAIRAAAALREKGVLCLDSPVSGGELGAIDATLSIMVGGEAEVFNQARPVLEALGQTITHCGPSGAGQTVKACNQIMVALHIAGMAEALVLGAKAGVDPSVLLQVLGGGLAQSRLMDARGPKVIRGDFAPGFKARLHFKDLNITLQAGAELGVPLPVAGLVRELFSALLAAGRGEWDHAALITVLEDLARVEARTRE